MHYYICHLFTISFTWNITWIRRSRIRYLHIRKRILTTFFIIVRFSITASYPFLLSSGISRSISRVRKRVRVRRSRDFIARTPVVTGIRFAITVIDIGRINKAVAVYVDIIGVIVRIVIDIIVPTVITNLNKIVIVRT